VVSSPPSSSNERDLRPAPFPPLSGDLMETLSVLWGWILCVLTAVFFFLSIYRLSSSMMGTDDVFVRPFYHGKQPPLSELLVLPPLHSSPSKLVPLHIFFPSYRGGMAGRFCPFFFFFFLLGFALEARPFFSPPLSFSPLEIEYTLFPFFFFPCKDKRP